MEALGLKRRLGLVVLRVSLQVRWGAPVRRSGVIHLVLDETSKESTFTKRFVLFLCCYAAPHSVEMH